VNKINALKIFHNLYEDNPQKKVFISSPFGYREVVKDSKGNVVAKKGFHRGIDYSAQGKSVPCYAVEDGKVLNKGKDTTGANFVYVYYPKLDMVGLYYHLASIDVKKSQEVTKDTQIGMLGRTGNATGIHLHFEWYPFKEHSKPFESRQRIDFDSYIFPNEEESKGETKQELNELKFRIGDKVIINGNLYVSSNAEKATGSVKEKITKITRVVNTAKHPYNTEGDLGWMDEEDITLYSESVAYIVKQGDNLSSIAEKYNTTWQKIYNDNREVIGDNPNLIKPGQKLIIK